MRLYEYQQRSTDCQKRESMIFAAVEGDNEHAIIDAGSNGTANFVYVVIAHEGNDEVELHHSEHDTHLSAFAQLGQFLADEYAGA
jgi:hypothetical protein